MAQGFLTRSLCKIGGVDLMGCSINSVGVFCGSASGVGDVFASQAGSLGAHLGHQQLSLVYGGGRVGLMGAVADGCLSHGGQVTGVMPRALVDKEIAHPHLTQLIIVSDMHERKAKMATMADAFIVLPGGTGTMEEFFEQWTWGQIGYHRKPIALLNVAGFFDPLLTMIDQMVAQGFLSAQYRDMLLCASDIKTILSKLSEYEHPPEKGYAQI
ncbi:TIGR00730 family Rossman fold protein [Roseobacter litoralis]|uniref:LOG family protein n=1 Tax=Roseobacter litoralis TaxID=42443 RepID=UPI0024940D6D|nr:TIGR00730 family Rossman fold protein [Roseobacter litoralis]